MSLLISTALLLGFGAADPAAGTAAQPPDIAGLIQQLGSRRFKEREAASKVLDRVGEPALEPLRRAAKDDADAEVRRRAQALVERLERRRTQEQVRRIINSTLSPAEKGRRLRRFIKPGMTNKQVEALLGPANSRDGTVHWVSDYYVDFELTVTYDRKLRVWDEGVRGSFGHPFAPAAGRDGRRPTAAGASAPPGR
jgi:hypothetical protein